MPTSFCRGPPVSSLCARLSAYFESRHSVPYAEIGIRHNIIVIGEPNVAECANPILLDDLPVEQSSHLGR